MKSVVIFLSLTALFLWPIIATAYGGGYNNRHYNGHRHGYSRPFIGYGRPYGGWYSRPIVSYSYIETSPQVVIREVEVPTTYIEKPSEQANQLKDSDYWYYCRKPDAYYPQVETCPQGWMQVIPHQPDN